LRLATSVLARGLHAQGVVELAPLDDSDMEEPC
jgi:hypothetical protein